MYIIKETIRYEDKTYLKGERHDFNDKDITIISKYVEKTVENTNIEETEKTVENTNVEDIKKRK